ncbi:MAG: sugar transferase [Acidimicrobiales bacterium]
MSLTDDEIVADIHRTFDTLDPRDGVRGWQRRQILGTIGADALAMAMAWYLTYLLAVSQLGWDLSRTTSRAYLLGGVAGTVAWVTVIALARGYDRRIIGISTDEYRRVLSGTCWFAAVTAVAAFYATVPLSRAFTVIVTVGAGSGSLMFRNGIRRWMHRQRRRGRCTKRVVVVGRQATAQALVRHFQESSIAEMTVVGLCVPEAGDGSAPGSLDGVSILGRPEDVWVQALHARADAIAIADTDALSPSQVKTLAWHLEGHGVEVMVVPAVTDVAGPRIQFRLAAGLPLIYLDEPRFGVVARTLKATFDRVLAAFTLIVTAPAMLVIAVVIRLADRGPALFRQTRVGLDGRHFTIVKFRTMVQDAEERLSAVQHLNEHDGLLFKIRDDPRITPVGRFLRRWSLDELPQMANVLAGQMSIVGPRPPLPSEVERYDARVRRRLRVKPGLTGLWQVSGRSELSWDEGIRLDLEYIEQWSLLLDLVVLVRTARAVVHRAGAH